MYSIVTFLLTHLKKHQINCKGTTHSHYVLGAPKNNYRAIIVYQISIINNYQLLQHFKSVSLLAIYPLRYLALDLASSIFPPPSYT